MHLITSYKHLKQTWNDMAERNIPQIKYSYECLSVFIYTTEKCSHHLHKAKVYSSIARSAQNG